LDKPLFFKPKTLINCNGQLMDLSVPRVMGILNATPDSFFDGGRYVLENNIASRVEQIINEGADIIDVGAVSTRPGSEAVDEAEEIRRLDFAMKILRKIAPEAIVSVDTYRSGVVKFIHEKYRIDLINDISAGNFDQEMPQTAANLNLPYIIMHIQGTPRDMQQNPVYENITRDIIKFFAQKIQDFKLMGINDIIVDPGFGFGKTIAHNYELMNHLEDFRMLELPVLVGISRKSMIYKYLGTSPADALTGTTVLNTIALQKGANILRVHDVKEAVETVKILNKFNVN
jgi:dihydropteroate synthase